MRKPSWFKLRSVPNFKANILQLKNAIKKSNLLFFVGILIFFAVLSNIWDSQTVSYAHAYTGEKKIVKVASPIFEEKENFFTAANDSDVQLALLASNLQVQVRNDGGINSGQFADKLYAIVGETPIAEMVPFISRRDQKVAAFLVGIAKKESSFGLASPSKDGKTCYNYWGYKGEGGRGVGMGYACFSNAEEAIRVVGDRIEVLVNKERDTPARMVDTWKCGKSCLGDPGAPGWIATVALYFEKIVG
ncbi:MAG: hypothetical protein WCI36_00260 [bacterium]